MDASLRASASFKLQGCSVCLASFCSKTLVHMPPEQLFFMLPIWLPEVGTMITEALPYHRLQQHPQDVPWAGYHASA